MGKPRILHVAGHLRTQQITEDGLCDRYDKAASVALLRGMTGTSGEQDFTSNMAGVQAQMMNDTGELEARATDACYHREQFVDWKPNLVIAHHIHRDGQNRAMFAVPDGTLGFHSDVANSESVRLMARIMGAYTTVTGIPITQDSVTLRMRQLYTWCYIDEDSQAIIPEYGHGTTDNVAIFNADRARIMAKFMTDCVLEHFDVKPVVVAPPPPAKPTADSIALELEAITAKVRAL